MCVCDARVIIPPLLKVQSKAKKKKRGMLPAGRREKEDKKSKHHTSSLDPEEKKQSNSMLARTRKEKRRRERVCLRCLLLTIEPHTSPPFPCFNRVPQDQEPKTRRRKTDDGDVCCCDSNQRKERRRRLRLLLLDSIPTHARNLPHTPTPHTKRNKIAFRVWGFLGASRTHTRPQKKEMEKKEMDVAFFT